ncbi:hypothetical protein P8452_60545 [Trifolium repens]|nr:hypothetical protein P8452_60545 [Trifolium repens]
MVTHGKSIKKHLELVVCDDLIADPGLKFTAFSDILNGKTRPDVFVDVIGAFHEIGYTQLVPGGRKLQVNLKLKDHARDVLNCTLWEDFATQFANYNNDRTECVTTRFS